LTAIPKHQVDLEGAQSQADVIDAIDAAAAAGNKVEANRLFAKLEMLQKNNIGPLASKEDARKDGAYSLVSRLDAAKTVTGIKNDKAALKRFDEFMEFISQPGSPIPPPFGGRYSKEKEQFPRWLCEQLRELYPKYKTLLKSRAQPKRKKV
jgi:hypothetical protein